MYPYHSYHSRDARVQPSVVAFARGDVTGDGVPDNVSIMGTKTSESPYIQNMTLVVQNGSTGAASQIPLRENAGYNPTLFLGDFTGDGVANVLVSINSGGSGGMMYHYIYSFVNGNARLLFDFNVYNEHYQYEVHYRDYYKVDVVSKNNKQKYVIDISGRDRQYLNEIYNSNGKLKSPIAGFVNPLSGLYPVDFDYNGVYELLAYQRIAGRYNADGLGFVLNTLGWKGNSFVLQNQSVAIYGTSF